MSLQRKLDDERQRVAAAAVELCGVADVQRHAGDGRHRQVRLPVCRSQSCVYIQRTYISVPPDLSFSPTVQKKEFLFFSA